MPRTDPVEAIIADALDAASISYVGENDIANAARLDFFLPHHGLYIECKRMASDRSSDQLSRADNVILIQGIAAARWLATMIGNW